MEVLGHYSNGAVLYQDGWSKFIAYDDCQTCDGSGYVMSPSRGMYYFGNRKEKEQCSECAMRFGLKDVLIARANEIQKLVKSELRYSDVKVNGKKLTPKAFAFANNFNVNHPLAKEYRLCLYRIWAYEEPDFYDEQGNLQEKRDRYIEYDRAPIGDWAFHATERLSNR